MTDSESSSRDYRRTLQSAVADAEAFVRLTFSQLRPADVAPWQKVSVRPVLIRGERQLQFSHFDGRKDVSKNYSPAEATTRLDELLDMPFTQIHCQTTSGDLHVRISKKGRALVSRGKASHAEPPPLEHNRPKQHSLPADKADPFLQAVGIQNHRGSVRASMQDKFRQVGEFLRVIEQVATEGAERRSIEIVDCGCGSAHLTFAAYHYLAHVLGRPARLTGVDVNEEVIAKCVALRDRLGWAEVQFIVSRIADFTPAQPPEIVLSLHACDTATDEALARAVQWGARAILAAPCCQHELHRELDRPEFRAALRQGILRERLADVVTDALRAAALRAMGYRTDVVEFISSEHTSKNLMIRAVRTGKPGHAPSVDEYKRLRDFWSVAPAIERLLGDAFSAFL